MFYNTIGITNPELKIVEDSNTRQTKLVLKIFENNPDQSYTPYEVQSMVEAITGFQPLIGSIRRCMTDLSTGDHPKLIKSETACAKGKYHLPNHVWRLAS